MKNNELKEIGEEIFELLRECTSIDKNTICINFCPGIDAEKQYDYLFKKLGTALGYK